jgi:hypothetical protein
LSAETPLIGAEGTGWLGSASNAATSAWAAATPAGTADEDDEDEGDDGDDEAPAEAELLGDAALLEAGELLELLLEEQAASSAAAVRAAAGAAKSFHVRVMLNIPPSSGHSLGGA